MIQSALDTYYNCIYLHKIIFIHVKKLTKYKKGVSARTAIFQLGKEWKVEEGAWQCRELGGAHGVLWGLLRGKRGRSLTFIAKLHQAWVTVWIKEVF